MVFYAVLCVVGIWISSCSALYTATDDVIELTAENFHKKVISGDEVWIVEFFAPWCGHCKNLVKDYKTVAKAFKGIVRVGAVDATRHQNLGASYNVQGFPTIKIFGVDKSKPVDYNGPRTASAIVDAVLSEVRKVLSSRLGKTDSGGSSKQSSSGKNDVIELNDSNFKKLVLGSKDSWLVEFFAPWCGHCKNLEPHWRAAATQLKGQVKVGAIDATVHTTIANEFGIRGFPTIKFFPPGSMENDAVDYDGGRTTSDIVNWATSKIADFLPSPEVVQCISAEVVQEQCREKQLCIFAFLPHILDCQSNCRNDYLNTLRSLSDSFKRNAWGWMWAEGGSQPHLEEAFNIGGIGYPTIVAMSHKKMKFTVLRGSFSKDGIREFLRDLTYGKGQTAPIKGTDYPQIVKLEPWDGKDAELPVQEDIDLSEVTLDHSEL